MQMDMTYSMRPIDVKNLDAKLEKESRKCFISLNAPSKTNWDLFIMVLATFNCFTIPLDVSFDPPSFSTTGFGLINTAIDLTFLADIIISFRTTFIDLRNGEEINASKEMA